MSLTSISTLSLFYLHSSVKNLKSNRARIHLRFANVVLALAASLGSFDAQMFMNWNEIHHADWLMFRLCQALC